MKMLLIDTTSNLIRIALKKDDFVIFDEQVSVMNHSTYVMSMIDNILQSNNIKIEAIDKIIVVNGPGSFTGIRIGVVIAKTLAYLKKIDIITISSLQAYSLIYDKCLVLLEDSKNKYYYGFYENNVVLEEGLDDLDIILEKKTKFNIDKVIDKDKVFDYNLVFKFAYDKQSLNPHLVNPYYLKITSAEESVNCDIRS